MVVSQARRQAGLMLIGLAALFVSTLWTNHQAQVVRARQIIDAGEIKVLLRVGPGKAQGPAGTPSTSP